MAKSEEAARRTVSRAGEKAEDLDLCETGGDRVGRGQKGNYLKVFGRL